MELPFNRYKCKPGSTKRLEGRFEIANAIYQGGPVTGGLHVHPDLFNYKGGIYELTTELGHEGGHAIKIIGWGLDE